jgi:hypothetical protein
MKEGAINWGIASVIIFLLGYLFGPGVAERIAPHHDDIRRFAVCFTPQVVALVCAIVAARRGSMWWAVMVAISVWMAIVCFVAGLVGDL